MFSMMSESMEYNNAAYCVYVLRRTTLKFKMAERQTGSTDTFLRTKDRNKIRIRTFKEHSKEVNLYHTVTVEQYSVVGFNGQTIHLYDTL
jgi:hypothetical protein